MAPIFESRTPSFYGYDGHGNVRFLTNTSGTAGNTYQFDAFGNQIASTGTTPNNYLFSGEQYDSGLSLLYLRARYYRMPTGRFLTRDPVEGNCCSPLRFNPYIYAVDDPANRLDPSGRQDIAEYASLLRTGLLVVRTICYAVTVTSLTAGLVSDIFTGSSGIPWYVSYPCVVIAASGGPPTY